MKKIYIIFLVLIISFVAFLDRCTTINITTADVFRPNSYQKFKELPQNPQSQNYEIVLAEGDFPVLYDSIRNEFYLKNHQGLSKYDASGNLLISNDLKNEKHTSIFDFSNFIPYVFAEKGVYDFSGKKMIFIPFSKVLNYDNELSNQDFKRIFESYYKNAEIVAYDTNRNFDYKRECLPMYFKIKNEWILLFTQKGELRFSHIQNGKLDDETVGQIDFQGFPAKLSDKKLIVLKETKENNYSAYSYSVSEKINDDFLNQSIGIELKEKKLDYSTQNFVEMLSRKKEEYYFTGSYFDLPDWVTPNFMNTGFFKLNYKGEDIFFKDKVLKHYNKTPQNNLFLYELPKKFRTKTKVAFLDYNLNIGGVMNNETSEVEPLNKNAGLYIVKPKKK